MRIAELLHSQPNLISKRKTNRSYFRPYCSLYNLSKLTSSSNVWNDSSSLKRTQKSNNIYLQYKEIDICFKKKLKFKKIESVDGDLAKDYVYLGSMMKTVLNQTGLTLDDEGNLFFIKGKRSDLFKGLLKKYRKTMTYLTCKIRLDDDPITMQFKALFINKTGQLIGIDKNTLRPYTLIFENPSEKNPREPNEINVIVGDAPGEYGIEHDLVFESNDEGASAFSLKRGKLYLTKYCETKDNSLFCMGEYEIKLPLKSNWTIRSIKKTIGVLQIEIKNKISRKTRITYLDPKYIFTEKDQTTSISHKPPQNLVSGLGNDPHESYFSGQPFSSTRLGNFSSKHIPLVSPVIDKFRVALKRAKTCYHTKQPRQFLKEMARSIDPGFEYLAKHLRLPRSESSLKEHESKMGIYAKHKANFIDNAQELKETLAENSVYVNSEEGFDQVLINLLTQINENDTLMFTSLDEVGLFFGVAAGGIPFNPGWFAGIVGILQNQYDIAVTKHKEGARFLFTHKSNKALVPLAGTGQGFEDNTKLIKTSTVDILTALPMEANLIMIANTVCGSSFGFDLKLHQVAQFVKGLSERKEFSDLEKILIEENQIDCYKHNNFIIQIETKTELRGELGFMANSNTYLVLPRTALGSRLALQLLTFQKQTQYVHGANKKRPTKSKSPLKFSVMGVEMNIFEEAKIMPVALKPGYMGTDNVWCFPMPLPEEYNAIFSYRKDAKMITQSKNNSDLLPSTWPYFHISKEIFPAAVQWLVQSLYEQFVHKQASDIVYECNAPSKMGHIKLFGTREDINTIWPQKWLSNLTNSPSVANMLDQLRDDYANLDEMIRCVDVIVANSERKSLHKESRVQIKCVYHIIESHFEKLKNQFFDILNTLEEKSKNAVTELSSKPFECEINKLKKIQSAFSDASSANRIQFSLKKIEITRRSNADKRLDTLQFAILKAHKTIRIQLIQPIGHIEFCCDKNLEKFKVTNCMLMEF